MAKLPLFGGYSLEALTYQPLSRARNSTQLLPYQLYIHLVEYSSISEITILGARKRPPINFMLIEYFCQAAANVSLHTF